MATKDLDWSDKFSTDIVSLDRQHQELLFLSQTLLGLLDDPAAAVSDKQAAFQNLMDHALDHFAYEERIMGNIGFPELESHAQEHDELRREIATIRDTVMQGDESEDWKGLISLIQVWVLRHIVSSDSQFREHIQREDEPENAD